MPTKYQPYVYFIIEALILLNGYLTARGINPIVISDSEIFAGVSYAFAFAAFVFAAWKNHNVTEAAQIAQQVLRQIKSGVDPFGGIYQTEADHEELDPED